MLDRPRQAIVYTSQNFQTSLGISRNENVERPDVISSYFKDSDAVDSHNHGRQFLLGLERHWRTPNPWFSLDCTFDGITVVDCWKAVRYHVPRYEYLTVEEFADSMAWDCVNNQFGKTAKSARGFIEADGMVREGQHCFTFEDPRVQVQAYLASTMDTVTKQVEGMCIRACGPAIMSPVSISSAIAGIGVHGIMAQTKLNESSGRPVNRKYIICGYDTRWVCSHPGCKAAFKMDKSRECFGVALCKDNKVRSLKHDPDNTQTCLQLHRKELESKSATSAR
jgi:hypothetical protein